MGRVDSFVHRGGPCGGLRVAAGGVQASAAPVAARWSVNVAPASAVTGPEVGGGRVYVGFATAGGTGGIRALDVVTGRTLWTRTLPCPVEVAPVYVPGNNRLYTAIDGRVFALNAADGKTVVTAGLEFTSRMYSLNFADGRLYVQTVADVTAFTPNLAPRWNFFFNDDATVLERAGRRVPLPQRRGRRGRRLHPVPQEVRLRHGWPGGEELRLRRRLHRPDGGAGPQRRRRWRRAGVYGWRTSNLADRWLNHFFTGLRHGQRQ